MAITSRDQWRGHAATVLAGTERWISESARLLEAVAERLEMRVHALRVSLDPEAAAWAAKARASAGDGSAAARAWGRDDFLAVLEKRRAAER